MRQGQIHSVDYLLENRRQLRQNLTSAEARLWQALRGSKLAGRKFRRQHSIEDYIVDFYCPTEKLIIELDGLMHNQTSINLNDQERDARLKQLEFIVLRFDNSAIIKDLGKVLATISCHFRKV
ncbi:endonuclease domain-containing protein [Adhaeribacter swui]|uniref:Endonuclease domain-containing protein n=1 Tax=Adhaeribacter swui TaxID=2086471 RepID=A0A7G7G6V8_9BACT|nr:endonuclease domain-containing protein [Adhaeribacter swui]QNF32892.1 endonuclease domain-containing protein [Adhaeribacter swui]